MSCEETSTASTTSSTNDDNEKEGRKRSETISRLMMDFPSGKFQLPVFHTMENRFPGCAKIKDLLTSSRTSKDISTARTQSTNRKITLDSSPVTSAREKSLFIRN